MKTKTLSLDELSTALAQIRQAEDLLSSTAMTLLNGKIRSADMDRLVKLAQRVRLYRYRLESYAPVSPTPPADSPPSDLPIIPCNRRGRHYVFYCLYCRREHYHCATDGYRAAHCTDPASPYLNHGYILREKTGGAP